MIFVENNIGRLFEIIMKLVDLCIYVCNMLLALLYI